MTDKIKEKNPVNGFHVFHHVYGKEGTAKMYITMQAPEVKGGFAHFVTTDNEELWISGNITIRARKIK